MDKRKIEEGSKEQKERDVKRLRVQWRNEIKMPTLGRKKLEKEMMVKD